MGAKSRLAEVTATPAVPPIAATAVADEGVAPAKANETEYVQLRAELLKTRDYQLQVIGVALTVTVGLIGYGLTSHAAAVLLIPVLPLTFAVSYHVNALVNLQRISTYLRHFHEGEESGLRYETLWAQLREGLRQSGGSGGLGWLAGHPEMLFIITGFTCLSLGAITGTTAVRGAAAGLALLWGAISIDVYRRVARVLSGEIEREMLQRWKALDDTSESRR